MLKGRHCRQRSVDIVYLTPGLEDAMPQIVEGVGRGFFANLIKHYAEEAHARLNLPKDAISDNHPGALRDHAHALKSSSRAVGAVETARLCERLEILGRAGAPLLDGARIAAELDGSLARTVRRLRSS